MPDQEKLQNEKEEPRTLTLEERCRWTRKCKKSMGAIICFLNRSAEAVVSQKKEQPKAARNTMRFHGKS